MPEHDFRNMNTKIDINQVLGKKLRIYADFLAATLQLRDAFEADDLEIVEQLTMERDNMIRSVKDLDHLITQSNRDNGKVDKKHALITDALNKILQKIINANNDCEAIGTAKCNLAKNELTSVRRKEKVISGYASKTRGIPKFLDVKT